MCLGKAIRRVARRRQEAQNRAPRETIYACRLLLGRYCVELQRKTDHLCAWPIQPATLTASPSPTAIKAASSLARNGQRPLPGRAREGRQGAGVTEGSANNRILVWLCRRSVLLIEGAHSSGDAGKALLPFAFVFC